MDYIDPTLLPSVRALLVCDKVSSKNKFSPVLIKSNINLLTDSSSVAPQDVTINSRMKFEVAVSRIGHKKHYFRLFATDICSPPIIRYDSMGNAHRNRDPNLPLHKQKVATPHFHIFDDLGNSFAYKHPKTGKKPNLDLNLGIKLFFEEARLRCSGGGFPLVAVQPQLLNS